MKTALLILAGALILGAAFVATAVYLTCPGSY